MLLERDMSIVGPGHLFQTFNAYPEYMRPYNYMSKTGITADGSMIFVHEEA
jgi:lipopolysaccharide/colanic/teichoic acid biosynthesis glycosyltransferase